ncbi:MAG: hypothetical protein AUH71_02105 [Thaumarchaeota archaeon 13_1_40CM_4_48_7]|nr:MAG: hypothetical protein AUH71_02105 [Thaumarchaeota archaeon 13_1_40CM_4_48_7]
MNVAESELYCAINWEKQMEFTPGDVVQLKSGGPPMTVERLGKTGENEEVTVYCTWFEQVGKRQELHRESFSPVVLEKYEPSFGVISTSVF